MNNLNVDQIRIDGAKNCIIDEREIHRSNLWVAFYGWKCKLKATLSCDVHHKYKKVAPKLQIFDLSALTLLKLHFRGRPPLAIMF